MSAPRTAPTLQTVFSFANSQVTLFPSFLLFPWGPRVTFVFLSSGAQRLIQELWVLALPWFYFFVSSLADFLAVGVLFKKLQTPIPLPAFPMSLQCCIELGTTPSAT